MNHALERTEHREALGWGILLALVTTLPYLLGYLGSPDGKYFLGFVLNPADQNTYFMWMTQVASGEMLLRNLYTSIPHDGAMLNLVFLAAGWTGRLLGSLDLAYQLLRVLAVVMLAWSVWLFVATFTASRERRRWLFLTVVFGAGVGWVFFSEDDVEVHTSLFGPYAVALVSGKVGHLSATQPGFRLYGWRDARVSERPFRVEGRGAATWSARDGAFLDEERREEDDAE